MSTILRMLEVVRYQLGLLGMAGLLVLIGGLMVGLAVVMPAQLQLQKKAHELSWLSTQPKIQATPQVAVLNDEQTLQKFYRQFPPVTDLPKVLEQIHQLAVDKGIKLAVGEYKLSNDATNQNLMRYELIFPVQASYKNMRDFIEAASLKFPTLGLSEISIKRDSIGDSAAQIKLNYVLLMVRNP